MKVEHFFDPNVFFKLLFDLFAEQEDRYNLLLSLLKRIIDNPAYYEKQPLMSAVYEAEQVKLVAMMTTPPKDLLLAAVNNFSAPALNALADDLWQQGLSLHGVNAEKKLSAAFAHLWGYRGAFKPVIGMQQRIYRIDQVVYPSRVGGFLRKATQKDKATLLLWANDFMQEALGEVDLEKAKKLVNLQLQMGNLFVWQDDQIVSMAAKMRETDHGAVISMVYTPQEFRGNGYASNLTAGLSDHFLKRGYQFCVLFTDLANPTSNSIYQKIGYYPLTDVDQYVFSTEL